MTGYGNEVRDTTLKPDTFYHIDNDGIELKLRFRHTSDEPMDHTAKCHRSHVGMKFDPTRPDDDPRESNYGALNGRPRDSRAVKPNKENGMDHDRVISAKVTLVDKVIEEKRSVPCHGGSKWSSTPSRDMTKVADFLTKTGPTSIT